MTRGARLSTCWAACAVVALGTACSGPPAGITTPIGSAAPSVGSTPPTTATGTPFDIATYTPTPDLTFAAVAYQAVIPAGSKCLTVAIPPGYAKDHPNAKGVTSAALAFDRAPIFTPDGFTFGRRPTTYVLGKENTVGGALLLTSDPDFAKERVVLPRACASHKAVWLLAG